jgi:hypothetical protein
MAAPYIRGGARGLSHTTTVVDYKPRGRAGTSARPSAQIAEGLGLQSLDFVSAEGGLWFGQIDGGPKLPGRRPPFGGLLGKNSYLERETGSEPASLCLGSMMLDGCSRSRPTVAAASEYPPQTITLSTSTATAWAFQPSRSSGYSMPDGSS